MYVIVKHNYTLQHMQGKIEKYHYAAHVIATHSSSPGDLMIKEKYIYWGIWYKKHIFWADRS